MTTFQRRGRVVERDARGGVSWTGSWRFLSDDNVEVVIGSFRSVLSPAGSEWSGLEESDGKPKGAVRLAARTTTTAADTGIGVATTERGPSDGSDRGPRRARLQVAHVDVPSVVKLSCLFSIVLFVLWMILAGVLVRTNAVDHLYNVLDSFYQTGPGTPPTSRNVFGGLSLVGVLLMVLTILATSITAAVYNLGTRLMGGVETTLTERGPSRGARSAVFGAGVVIAGAALLLAAKLLVAANGHASGEASDQPSVSFSTLKAGQCTNRFDFYSSLNGSVLAFVPCNSSTARMKFVRAEPEARADKDCNNETLRAVDGEGGTSYCFASVIRAGTCLKGWADSVD